MGIRLHCNVVIARKTSTEANFPGGVVRLRSEWPAYAEDEHLIAFCSMGQGSAELVERLLEFGLGQSSIAFGDELEGIYEGCDWLEVVNEGIGRNTCWLKETLPDDFVEPIIR
jgi:hypothetical protein